MLVVGCKDFSNTEDVLFGEKKFFVLVVLESNVFVPGCDCAFDGSTGLTNLNGSGSGAFTAGLFPFVFNREFPKVDVGGR